MDPVSARLHVAVVEESRPHGWFAMLRAWVKGMNR